MRLHENNVTLSAAASDTLAYIIAQAKIYYAASDLQYHNLEHVIRMLKAADSLAKPGVVSINLAMAIIWHDAIYVPGGNAALKLGNANEKLSSMAFRQFAGRHMTEEIASHLNVDEVCRLIEATAVENHMSPTYRPQTDEEAMLMDVDLETLAVEYDEFLVYQQKIVYENMVGLKFVPDVHLRKCAEFLTGFLQKPFIYHSKARDLWEAPARDNIQRLIDDFN